MKTFRVSSYITGNGYKHYRYFCDGYIWNIKEILEIEEKIRFIFSSNMKQDDINKVIRRWRNKL